MFPGYIEKKKRTQMHNGRVTTFAFSICYLFLFPLKSIACLSLAAWDFLFFLLLNLILQIIYCWPLHDVSDVFSLKMWSFSIYHIGETATSKTTLKSYAIFQGDVIVSFNDVSIGCEGTVPFRSTERIAFRYLISQK